MDSLDKLTIDTPEQIAIEFPLAGIGSRFLAIVFDILLQFIGYFVLGLIAALVLGGELRRIWPSAWNWSAAVFIFVAFCLYWATTHSSKPSGRARPPANAMPESG